MRYLTSEDARRRYDRRSVWRESQAFYARRPLEELIDRGAFKHAESVFEFGCGTGLFAAHLLARHLPENARYLGIDVSPQRVHRAGDRLRPWSRRAEVRVADGSMVLPAGDREFERFVSNYVLDLLRPEDRRAIVSEAHRTLLPGGRVCLATLTPGNAAVTRIVMAVWERAWLLRPQLVGGCRPIQISDELSPAAWALEHRSVVSSFAISSEVVIARRLVPPRSGAFDDRRTVRNVG